MNLIMILSEHPIRDAEAEDGTKLCLSVRAEGLKPHELDEKPGHLRFPDDGTWEFSKFVDARLAFGLWQRCGPFDLDVAPAVPLDIAKDTKPALAAWVKLRPERENRTRSLAQTADQLGISKQPVSNYLSEIRYEF